jgi:hypothetical protein
MMLLIERAFFAGAMRWSNELEYNYPRAYLIVGKLIEAIIHSRREPGSAQSSNATTITAVVLPGHQLLSKDRSVEGRDRAWTLHGDRRRQLRRSGDR